MKFTIEKAVLQNAVLISARAVPSKSPISALEGLMIEAGTKITITGYDLKKAIYTTVESDIEEPFAACRTAWLPLSAMTAITSMSNAVKANTIFPAWITAIIRKCRDLMK